MNLRAVAMIPEAPDGWLLLSYHLSVKGNHVLIVEEWLGQYQDQDSANQDIKIINSG